MSLPGPKFTYEDYKLMPEDKRCEVIEGELLMTPSPTTNHQSVQAWLTAKLLLALEGNGLGKVLPAPTDVILADDNVVQPDVLFVTQERQGIIDRNGGVNGAPDLVVEILSPPTARRDQVIKRKLYSKYGVREYWVVDPEGCSVEVSVLGANGLETWRVFPVGSALVSPLCPSLSIPVGELFPKQ